MSNIEVKIPDIGGATDVEVIEIYVSVGDEIGVDDPLLVLESDKASMDVPSTHAGKVEEIKVSVGDKVNEGDVIILLSGADSGGDDAKDESADKPAKQESAEEKPAASEKPAEEKADKPAPAKSGSTSVETVKVPDIGGFDGVEIIEVVVKAGDQVGVDDSLLVLESDKATMEVPSPFAGEITKVLVSVGDKVSEGSEIAEMKVQGGGGEESSAPKEETPSSKEAPAKQEAPASKPESKPAEEKPAAPAPADTTGGKVHAGPAVRKLAREFGVDLGMVSGTGPKNRILKEDVQGFVKSGMQQLRSGGGSVTGGSGIPAVKLPDFSQFGKVDRLPMSRIHQLTAENMSRSWLNVPHVTQFDHADITELETFRKDQKAIAEKKGTRLTPLPFMLKACAYALQTYPQFNVSLDLEKNEVVQKHYIHIGIAVDTPAGLVVPVIRDVDQKGIWELASECAEMAARAKDKKLKPNEMQGGCFSISSLGSIGGSAFTPIVNSPEVAILGVSKAEMKPVWDGKDFQPRLMLPLCLSYDHRAINGADAARFTALLAELLGDIRKLLL